MLAQVGRIAEETEELAARASALDEVQVPSSVQSGTQLFDALSEMVSHVQAMVGSAAYPSVSVSPIAVFREAHPVT